MNLEEMVLCYIDRLYDFRVHSATQNSSMNDAFIGFHDDMPAIIVIKVRNKDKSKDNIDEVSLTTIK
jgi:hypothetical protein